MCASKTLVRMSICSFESKIRTSAVGTLSFSVPIYLPCFPPLKALRCVPSLRRSGLFRCKQVATKSSNHSGSGAGGFLSVVAAAADYVDEGLCDESGGLPMDALEKLLTTNKEEMSRFMKMERKRETSPHKRGTSNWFPYLDVYKVGESILTSGDVLEALSPYIMQTRKERFRVAVQNRTYSVCLVIEGLNDVGNASAIFRSADALGFQSVHVISFDCSKRCYVI